MKYFLQLCKIKLFRFYKTIISSRTKNYIYALLGLISFFVLYTYSANSIKIVLISTIVFAIITTLVYYSRHALLKHLLRETVYSKYSLGNKNRFYSSTSYRLPKEEPKRILNELSSSLKDRNEIKEKELILVVEDNHINFLLLKQMLESNKHPYIWAENGKIAINKFIENKNIKLILMDISMPVMDGYQAITEIRKINIDIPIIAQTAHGLTEDIKKMKSHGFDDYLTKPLNKNKLLKTMEYHLEKPNKYSHAN